MQASMRRTARTRLLAVVLIIAAVVLSGCRGPKVPDVVGMPLAEAQKALEDEGYTLGTVTPIATQTVGLGEVAAQVPVASEAATEGTAVALQVNYSDGVNVIVPVVTGAQPSDATTLAVTLGLATQLVEQPSTTVTEGLVATQVPSPGSIVKPGDTLLVVVSAGKAATKVRVPAVVGKSQSDAESAIEQAGLVATVHKNYSSSVAKGLVAAQSPAGGSQVTKGAQVDVLVSLGKGVGAVTVPKVAGKTEADASKALKNVGLAPIVYRDYSDTVAKGTVVEQLPEGGTTTAAGAEIAILVSLGKQP